MTYSTIISISFQETDFKMPTKIFSDNELDHMKLKYYDEQVHRAAFILPRFIAKALAGVQDKN